MKISAKYIGRNRYVIAVDGITEVFYEPFFNNPEGYTRRISKIVEEFNIKDIELNDADVWSALAKAAEEAGRYFPECLKY